MNGLIFDTSSNLALILLAQGASPLSFKVLEGGAMLSKHLGRLVQKLLLEHPGNKPDYVAVGIGPGSYTGIRVGVALAKALAFGWSVPLLSFCSLKTFLPSHEGPFAILVDARMGGVYAQKGEKKGSEAVFEAPVRLSLACAAEEVNCPLFSPHPEELFKRSSWNRPITLAVPNPDFLAVYCSNLAPFVGQPAQDFLNLTYLSNP
jgi:tRNA threonylcarbamoyl adenosine modification protein YeaZ